MVLQGIEKSWEGILSRVAGKWELIPSRYIFRRVMPFTPLCMVGYEMLTQYQVNLGALAGC